MGDSLSAFLEKVGIPKGGGPRTRLREQMDRLFTAHFQLRYDDARGKSFISSQIADSGEFWWSERKPDERTLWQSKIVLSHEFFNEIIRHPVPLDMNTLKALTRSPLGRAVAPSPQGRGRAGHLHTVARVAVAGRRASTGRCEIRIRMGPALSATGGCADCGRLPHSGALAAPCP